MKTFTEAPDQLAPPPNSPNEGLARTKPVRRRREGLDTLIPMVHLEPGDLFPRVLRDGEDYPFDKLVPVLKEQDVEASLGEDGAPQVERNKKYTFTGVVFEGRRLWRRTPNPPPDKI
jgi:hypothetical protein